jgi:N-acetylneuraminic acid mutarotase
MRHCRNNTRFGRSVRLPLCGLSAAALLLASACQDSPTEPEQIEPAELPGQMLAVAASNTWLTRANMPGDARRNIAAATVTNAQNQTVLYVFGGRRERSDGSLGVQLRTVQAYNAATNSWSDKNPSPLPLELTHGARVIGGKIYIAGGKEGFSASSSLLWQYSPATDAWTRKQNLPVEGSAGVSGVIGGRLYVLTRCEDCDNPDYQPPNDPRFFGAYDPATDQWTPLALPPGGRDHQHGAAGVIGGKLYVAGGRTTNALDIYDPATNHWSTGASMGSIRGYTASAAVAGKLYVIAGDRFVYNSDGSIGSIEAVATTSRYDPATNTWKNLARSPRGGDGLAADRVVVSGQPRIDLVGGARPGNNLQYVP